MIQFEKNKERQSIIKVIGVGGGGSNAVNHMYKCGIRGVEFLVCNTDEQALETSPVPHKIQLGKSLTDGRGAGAIPEVGKNAALENLEDIKRALGNHTRMIFITAGMGGGTGTGAAPVIAKIAREMNILTVAIVTVPFHFEGKKRRQQADSGIEELKKYVDTLLIICNDKLREIHGNLKIAEAFAHADNILAVAARSIAEIISETLHINVDFADVQTVMKDSGVAIMGSATAEGPNRAITAVEAALDSPLLNDNDIEGARYILLNITSGTEEITMDEMSQINEFVQDKAGQTADIILGMGYDEQLGEKISVTIIATGFKTSNQKNKEKPVEKVVYDLSGNLKQQNETVKSGNTSNPLEPVLKSETDEPAALLIQQPHVENDTLSVPARNEDGKIIYSLSASEKQQACDSPPAADEPVLITKEGIQSDNVAEPVTDSYSESGIISSPLDEPDDSFIFEPVNEQPYEPVTGGIGEHISNSEKDLEFYSLPDNKDEQFSEPEQDQNGKLIEFTFEIKNGDETEESKLPEAETNLGVESSESSTDDLIKKEEEIRKPEPDFTDNPMHEPKADLPVVGETPTETAGEQTDKNEIKNNPDQGAGEAETAKEDPHEELFRRSRERIVKLKELSVNQNQYRNISDLEKEPAYRRRNIVLDDVPPSSSSRISRLTLSQDDTKEGGTGLKPNGYLHDKAD